MSKSEIEIAWRAGYIAHVRGARDIEDAWLKSEYCPRVVVRMFQCGQCCAEASSLERLLHYADCPRKDVTAAQRVDYTYGTPAGRREE